MQLLLSLFNATYFYCRFDYFSNVAPQYYTRLLLSTPTYSHPDHLLHSLCSRHCTVCGCADDDVAAESSKHGDCIFQAGKI